MPTTQPPAYLTICAIVKDEDKYLDEWVAFHLAVGAERFLIIDNAKRGNAHRVLSMYIEAGYVEVMSFSSKRKQQREAYNRAVRYLEGKSRWVAFLDIDEFLVPQSSDDVRTVLHEFEEHPALAVNWVAYGSNGHQESPSGWVIEEFTDRGPLNHTVPLDQLKLPEPHLGLDLYRPMNSHVKCIVQPELTVQFRTAHHFKYRNNGQAVTENYEPISGPFSGSVSINHIRINHYWSKSLDDMRDKIAKGRISQATHRSTSGYNWEEAVERERASSGVRDEAALRFLKRAQEISRNHPPGALDATTRVRRLRYLPRDWIHDRFRKLTAWTRHFRRTIRRMRAQRDPLTGE